jgi:hypothetical protein
MITYDLEHFHATICTQKPPLSEWIIEKYFASNEELLTNDLRSTNATDGMKHRI